MQTKHISLTAWSAALCLAMAGFGVSAAYADDSINVYGPGGPAPALKEAARAFGELRHTTVNVFAGPTGQWVEKAKADADVVFSGSESMMGDFAKALPESFDLASADPLYLRPVSILVGVVAWRRPHSRLPQPTTAHVTTAKVRTDFGRPAPSIRLSTSTAMATSAC